MKKQLLSPFLNIVVAILILTSRLLSDDGFDWLAITALILILVSVGQLLYVYKKSK